jgi:alpha-tubulin suppressor-like RCC1 family protein
MSQVDRRGFGFMQTLFCLVLAGAVGMAPVTNRAEAAREPASQSLTTNSDLRQAPPPTTPRQASWASVSVGVQNTCAITAATTVQCWGDSFYGQVGDGVGDFTNGISETRIVPAPADVVGLTNQVMVAVGYDHACSLSASGTIACWGSNLGRQINSSSMIASSVPVPVVGITNAIEIAAGYQNTCALLGTGTVKCWGSILPEFGDGRLGIVEVPGIPAATQISSSNGHTCIRTVTGRAWCWGDNNFGALGDTTLLVLQPFEIPGLNQVAEVHTGATHTCALLLDETVSCWGESNAGQLGDGSLYAPWRNAGPVPGLTGVKVLTVGTVSTCALLGDGSVKCWGGLLALGNGIPVYNNYVTRPGIVQLGDAASSVASGQGVSCVLFPAGHLKCWGSDNHGQLGDGEGTYDQYYPTPVSVTAVTSAPTRRPAS